MKYILASASPRRRELLAKTGIEYSVIPSDVEEKITKISNLMTYLRRLGEITNMGSATKPLWKLSDKR